jgi:uncharacterized membrane protein
MRFVQLAYAILYIATVFLFGACAVALIAFATVELWQAISPPSTADTRARFDSVLEAIGLATIAVASLELSQTVLEEEVQRKASMSAPTRVRRFLSRFLIVVVVSLAIECLVAVFTLVHRDPSRLFQAAAIGVVAALLLAAWGLFVRWNVVAERLEPEAMKRAKREDRHVDTDSDATDAPKSSEPAPAFPRDRSRKSET